MFYQFCVTIVCFECIDMTLNTKYHCPKRGFTDYTTAGYVMYRQQDNKSSKMRDKQQQCNIGSVVNQMAVGGEDRCKVRMTRNREGMEGSQTVGDDTRITSRETKLSAIHNRYMRVRWMPDWEKAITRWKVLENDIVWMCPCSKA